MTSAGGDPTRSRLSGWRLAGRVLRVVVSVAAIVVAAVVVNSKRDELSGAAGYLTHLRVVWILVGAGFELLAITAFALLQRRLLLVGGVGAGLGKLMGISFAGNALQNSLPGGAAFASVYAFRQFRRLGADDVLATWTLVAVSVLSSVGLAVVSGTGLALSGSDAATFDLVGAIIGVIAIAVALVVLARTGWLGRIVVAAVRLVKRVTGHPRRRVDTVVQETQDRLRAVTPSRGDWVLGLAAATANWAWDCACLATSFLAVGAVVPWRGLLLAYGAAQLAANLPITPGGLGVVEGSLTIALVAYGGGQASTVAAVVIYRLLSFWLLLLVGWIAIGVIAYRHSQEPDAEVVLR